MECLSRVGIRVEEEKGEKREKRKRLFETPREQEAIKSSESKEDQIELKEEPKQTPARHPSTLLLAAPLSLSPSVRTTLSPLSILKCIHPPSQIPHVRVI